MGRSTTPYTIVLDLDQTLIATQEDMEREVYEQYKTHDTSNRLYDIDVTDADGRYITWGLRRPHLKAFLDFCFKYFREVIVWTAGTYEYGHAIVNAIFENQRPHRILTRNDCERINSGKYEGELAKPISLLDLDPRLTITLDDKDFTGVQNPKNVFVCPGYYPDVGRGSEIDIDRIYRKDNDHFLLDFMDFLLSPEVMTSKDLRQVPFIL